MMKCKTAMLITGIIILLSGQCYALEEKITVTPSQESAYVFDIKVSGKTSSPRVRVVHRAFFEGIDDACPVQACESSYCTGQKYTLRLYVAISKCEIHGLSDPEYTEYSHIFRWYYDGFIQYTVPIELYLRENPSVSELTDYGSYKLVATETYITPFKTITPVSIGKTIFEVSGTDTFTAHQVSLPGYDGLYWGTFQWNPYTLSWTLKDAGVEK